MSDDPVNLDEWRGAVERTATRERRGSTSDVLEAQEPLSGRRAEFESLLFAEPADTWLEVAVKAHYLVQQYAKANEAQDAHNQLLAYRVLDELSWLIDSACEKL